MLKKILTLSLIIVTGCSSYVGVMRSVRGFRPALRGGTILLNESSLARAFEEGFFRDEALSVRSRTASVSSFMDINLANLKLNRTAIGTAELSIPVENSYMKIAELIDIQTVRTLSGKIISLPGRVYTVGSNIVRLYSGPSTTYNVLATLSNGKIVLVLEQSGDFFKVIQPGASRIGFIQISNLKPAANPLPNVPESIWPKQNIGGDPFEEPKLNLYTNPSKIKSVLIGLKVRWDELINSVTPIFQNINDDGTLGNKYYGNKLGGSGGGFLTELSLNGHVVTGLNLRVGQVVDQIQLVYKKWLGNGVISNKEVFSEKCGGNGGNQYLFRSNSNCIAFGIQGYSGSHIDRIELQTVRLDNNGFILNKEASRQIFSLTQTSESLSKSITIPGPLPKTTGGTVFFDSPNKNNLDKKIVLVGMNVEWGDIINSIMPIYRKVESDGSLGEIINGDYHGGNRGGRGHNYSQIIYDGYVVTGLNIELGVFVNKIQIVFNNWTTKNIPGGEQILSPILGVKSGTKYQIRCAPEHVATGIQGRSGSVINRISIISEKIMRDDSISLVPMNLDLNDPIILSNYLEFEKYLKDCKILLNKIQKDYDPKLIDQLEDAITKLENKRLSLSELVFVKQ